MNTVLDVETLKKELESSLSDDSKEQLLKKDTSKYCLFPLDDKEMYFFYERQRDMFWTTQEINFSNDRDDWNELSNDEREFIKFILCFFAQADGIVTENLSCNFQEEVNFKEAQAFYALQGAMEVIHNETYSTMIETVFRDGTNGFDCSEKEKIFDSIRYCPPITKMAQWITHWMDRKYPLLVRLLAFACFEGIFFSSAFCSIRWLMRRNVLNGFCQANEFISRDEKLHLDFAIYLMNKLNIKEHLDKSVVEFMISTSSKILDEFVRDALKVELLGMNPESMIQYTKCCYDYLTSELGYGKFYDASNPFEWMIENGMANKTNFFEKKVTEYARVDEKVYIFERKKDF